MSRQSAFAIRLAIENCLSKCRESETPLACLAETVEGLHSTGWRDRDVRTVEVAVLGVLLGALVDSRLARPDREHSDSI